MPKLYIGFSQFFPMKKKLSKRIEILSRFQKILNPVFAENFSSLSYWEVRNPHPLYNLGSSWTSPLIPNIKYQRINGKNWTDFIIVKFQNFDFFKTCPTFVRSIAGPILYLSTIFFGPNHFKKVSLCSWKITKETFYRKGLKIFHGFENLGFLTNARSGAMRSKTQWVFYRDQDWWPGPQKVQFGEITVYL